MTTDGKELMVHRKEAFAVKTETHSDTFYEADFISTRTTVNGYQWAVLTHTPEEWREIIKAVEAVI